MGAEGFEPSHYRLKAGCSEPLSYTPERWSGRRESNSRHAGWKPAALPAELRPHVWRRDGDSNPGGAFAPTAFQAAAINRSAIPPEIVLLTLVPRVASRGVTWQGRVDSNHRMSESKSDAVPLGYAPIHAAKHRRFIRCREMERVRGLEPLASTMARSRSTS